MSLERSNGYAEGRDSLRWALDKMRKLEAREREAVRLLTGWRDSGLISDSKLAGDTDKLLAKTNKIDKEIAE